MRYSKLGGQAVIEGVMMKHEKEYSVAVRKPDGGIEVTKKSGSSSFVSVKNLSFSPRITDFSISLPTASLLSIPGNCETEKTISVPSGSKFR